MKPGRCWLQRARSTTGAVAVAIGVVAAGVVTDAAAVVAVAVAVVADAAVVANAGGDTLAWYTTPHQAEVGLLRTYR